MAEMIIIDGNNWCWRANWVGRDLTSKGRRTGVLHVGFSMLQAMGELFPPQRVMFLWDSKNSWRKKLYPEYKANREVDPERVKERGEVYKQIALFRQVTQAIGITQVEQDGLEADDLAGIIASTCQKSGRPLIMISSDKDWYQLLNENNKIVKGWTGKKLEEVTKTHVLEKYGVPPVDWPKYQALLGESGDNIPKVRRGIGPVTALKMLTLGIELSKEELVQYEFNLQLTTLRTTGSLVYKWPEQTTEGWKFLEAILENYDLSELWTSRGRLWAIGKWGRK